MSTTGTATTPTFDDVTKARERLAGVAHRTPVMTSRYVDSLVGGQLFFKCENLQRAGAFKFRGAYNAIASLTPDQRRRGVAAYSSGNHAQAIALAASLQDTPAVILMPEDSPAVKLAATRSYGAEVVTYDRYAQDREVLGAELAGKRGLTLIPPFDHEAVIAGQGTAAAELFEETGPLDLLLVCLGGGGLLAGSSLSAAALSPDCRVVGVEPEAGDDGRQSLEAGRIVTIPVPRTIADGAQTTHLGALTFPIIRRHVERIVTVGDADLLAAMRIFFERMKIVVEPTGCLSLAAALSEAVDCRGQRVGVIVSGGNVDMARAAALLAG
ncbi:threo-3-hydroxy-L-aspartate ammonia-lyase [Aurantimonas sp. VKM B-3413]|nr:threo-3-hydroxy-L-aspartate ammonia-lyase [Aurantimonas sp. VKM B-3413]